MDHDPIRDDPEWLAWERDVRENLIPKLDDSTISLSIVPNGEADIKYAVELGLSIMMDKPILLVVAPGQVIPRKLRQIADRIVALDLRAPNAYELEGHKLQAAVDAMMRRYGDG